MRERGDEKLWTETREFYWFESHVLHLDGPADRDINQ